MDKANVYSVASELGIDTQNLDEGSEFETESESTEAEGEVENEEVSSEAEVSDEDESEEATTPEGEETIEADSPEESTQTPEPTAEQLQEIETQRESLAVERQAFLDEKAAWAQTQKDYEAKLKTHDQFDAFLAELAEKDPEFFGLLQTEYKEHQKQYSNPVIEELPAQNVELSKRLDSFVTKTTDQVTMQKLDQELTQVKSTIGKDAEAKGLKIDWAKVEDTWADNPKLGVEGAFYALYGKSYSVASASKAKVETVTKKVAARPSVATAGSVKSTAGTPPAKDFSKMSTRDTVGHFAKQFLGKA